MIVRLLIGGYHCCNECEDVWGNIANVINQLSWGEAPKFSSTLSRSIKNILIGKKIEKHILGSLAAT